MYLLKRSYLVLLALVMFGGWNSTALAQQPAPQPQMVFAYYSYSDAGLFLDWQITERNDVITAFTISVSLMDRDSLPTEAQTFTVSIDDPYLQNKEYEGINYFALSLMNIKLDYGSYEVTVTSTSKDGNSLPSEPSYFFVDNDKYGYLYFTETPSPSASINQKYESFIKAESYDKEAIINYELIEAPEGMTIGKETGKIEFTPTSGGYVYFLVRAYDTEEVSNFIEFYATIYVSSCDMFGKITGQLTFTENTQKPGGIVFAYRFTDSAYIQDNFTAEVDANGSFSMEIDKGSYYLYFMPFEPDEFGYYQGEWYKDAVTIENAQVINIDCGQNTQITWTVGDETEYTKYKVSGYVKLNDGSPLANSYVNFESVYMDKDSLNNGYRYYSRSTSTNENGYYEVILPDAFKYIAYAFAFGPDGKAYRAKYWNDTYDPSEATPIELTSDLNNINFTFKKEDFEIQDGSISGIISNTDDEVIANAFVVAFLVNPYDDRDKEEVYEGFAALTNDNGEYYFDYLPYGEYIIASFALGNEYVPGFYTDKNTPAFTWEDATIIKHDGYTPLKDINIVLTKMQEKQGVGNINGKISSLGGGIKEDREGEAISGATILLIGEDGVANKYSKSANDGKYNLNNLANGKYQLIVDKVGYLSHKEWVEVKDAEIINGHNIELFPIDVTSVDDNITIENIAAYPNPASSNVNFEIDANSNNVTIEVYNLMGMKQLSIDKNTVIGKNLVNINVENLPSGQYLVKIIDSNKISASTIIINR